MGQKITSNCLKLKSLDEWSDGIATRENLN